MGPQAATTSPPQDLIAAARRSGLRHNSFKTVDAAACVGGQMGGPSSSTTNAHATMIRVISPCHAGVPIRGQQFSMIVLSAASMAASAAGWLMAKGSVTIVDIMGIKS